MPAISLFIGREAERAQLAAWLPERRLVTVVGPGGIGKTRLAEEVCAGELAAKGIRIVACQLAAFEPREESVEGGGPPRRAEGRDGGKVGRGPEECGQSGECGPAFGLGPGGIGGHLGASYLRPCLIPGGAVARNHLLRGDGDS